MSREKLTLLGFGAVFVILIALCAFLTSGKKNVDGEAAENTTESSEAASPYGDNSEGLPVVFNIADGVNLAEVNAERLSLPEGMSERYDLNDEKIRLYLKGDSLFIEGYEDCALNSDIAGQYIDGFYTMYASRELKTHGDAAEYGLDKPIGHFEMKYSDGSGITFDIGNPGTDKNAYYVSCSLSDSVYMVTSSTVYSYFCGLNELLDKSINTINQNEICFIGVKDNVKGRELLISYDKTETAANGKGLTSLKMHKPIEGLTVYPYNLQTTLFEGFSTFRPVDIAAVKPLDLSPYGLDKPKYEIGLQDTEEDNSLMVYVGNEADEYYSYCMFPEGNIVFTMPSNAISSFTDYNIFDFVERLVDLQNRKDVDSAVIETKAGERYVLKFGEDTVGDKDVDNRVADFNGKEYDRTGISPFYQLLIGIAFDRIEDKAEIKGDAEVSIEFDLLSGSKIADKYYNYDENYYVVEKDGVNTGFLVKRSDIKAMLDKAREISQ